MLWVAMLLACSGEKVPESVDTQTPVDTGIPWPEDTGSAGTDDDGDGWTVEEGDCNDADILVNPAREEVPDGQDNDCDGRVDEQFSGIVALKRLTKRTGKSLPGEVIQGRTKPTGTEDKRRLGGCTLDRRPDRLDIVAHHLVCAVAPPVCGDRPCKSLRIGIERVPCEQFIAD